MITRERKCLQRMIESGKIDVFRQETVWCSVVNIDRRIEMKDGDGEDEMD